MTDEQNSRSDTRSQSPNTWTETAKSPPENGVVVETMINDERGIRNQCELKRDGRLWLTKDEVGYVYYTPTHWRAVV